MPRSVPVHLLQCHGSGRVLQGFGGRVYSSPTNARHRLGQGRHGPKWQRQAPHLLIEADEDPDLW